MSELKELLERVRAATGMEGPNEISDLDAAIYNAFPPFSNAPYLPPYSTSVDAAMALVRRVLPGWVVSDFCQNSRHAGDPWGCELSNFHGSNPFKDKSAFSGWDYPEPALAILAALLTALIAQEPK